MGTDRLAVRSSYSMEDVGEHTFDGIFDTRLDVPLVRLFEEIRAIRESTITEASIRYASERGITLEDRMSVIVQTMVQNPDFTGVIYTKFPSTYDVAKITRRSPNGGEYTDVFRRHYGQSRAYIDENQPLLSSSLKDVTYVGPIVNSIVRYELEFGHPILCEFAYNRPLIGWWALSDAPEARGKAFLLQARRLTEEDSSKSTVQKLSVKGLLGQTRAVNGVGDIQGIALVVYEPPMNPGKFEPISETELTKAKKFDKEHPEGYILVTPYMEFYGDDELDGITSNKIAVVSYSYIGRHHDFDLARSKGLLYLGFGSTNESFTPNDIKGNRYDERRIIITGDILRVVSDGVEGFIYNLSRN